MKLIVRFNPASRDPSGENRTGTRFQLQHAHSPTMEAIHDAGHNSQTIWECSNLLARSNLDLRRTNKERGAIFAHVTARAGTAAAHNLLSAAGHTSLR